MSLLPTFTQPKTPQWRGNTSSADMNQNFEEIPELMWILQADKGGPND